MALIPPGNLNAVVSLGTLAESFRHCGTGFLYAHPVLITSGRTSYGRLLVTNRRVMDGGQEVGISKRTGDPQPTVPRG